MRRRTRASGGPLPLVEQLEVAKIIRPLTSYMLVLACSLLRTWKAANCFIPAATFAEIYLSAFLRGDDSSCTISTLSHTKDHAYIHLIKCAWQGPKNKELVSDHLLSLPDHECCHIINVGRPLSTGMQFHHCVCTGQSCECMEGPSSRH